MDTIYIRQPYVIISQYSTTGSPSLLQWQRFWLQFQDFEYRIHIMSKMSDINSQCFHFNTCSTTKIDEEEPKNPKEQLKQFGQQGSKMQTVQRVSHGSILLNSFADDFWIQCFLDLFFRGDCKEKYNEHKPQLGGKKWIRLLLRRADFKGWSQSKEFAASVYNVLLRREQMLQQLSCM